MRSNMKNTQEINKILSEFLTRYPEEFSDQLWDIMMSLLFSEDFQAWGTSDQYNAFDLLRNMGRMVENLRKVFRNE